MDEQLLRNYEKEAGAEYYDCLTGLYNHGLFQVMLAHEMRRSERTGRPFTLALLDVDWFAEFNEQHGYAIGDRALKEISRLIQANIRQTDIACRFGSDLFAILLVDADSNGAKLPLERLRGAIAQSANSWLTASIGMVCFPEDGGDPAEPHGPADVITKSYEALQLAKSMGKNQVHHNTAPKDEVETSSGRVLVVDDNDLNRKLIRGILASEKYEVTCADSGQAALKLAREIKIDLVLLDVMMPGMDGFEVCRRLKGSDRTRLVPIILVTALNDMEAKIRGIEAGADDFIAKPPNKTELLARTKSLIHVKRLNQNLTSIENVLFSLANAVEAKDSYTQGHVERVANLAVELGRRLRLPKAERQALRYGGILHDIGKIGMPNAVINKPGPLDDAEWQIMHAHPDVGYKICLPLKQTLGAALDVIRHHHEKLDGSGYPDGIAGPEISMVARIMAVADIYDALVTDRPYRKGMSREKALHILNEEADQGKLDKTVLEALEVLLNRQMGAGSAPPKDDRLPSERMSASSASPL
ncbi:MAG: diguanylate cyclase [Desulfosarcinaceae bacterium]|jgi:putative two-component system response regulator